MVKLFIAEQISDCRYFSGMSNNYQVIKIGSNKKSIKMSLMLKDLK